MSNAANAALYEPWKDLWSGDLSLTDTIIAEDFAATWPAEGTGPDQFHGRQPLNDWISGIHAILPTCPSSWTSARSPTSSTWSCGGRRAAPIAAASPAPPRRGRPGGHLHRHRHPAHRRRQVRRVLG